MLSAISPSAFVPSYGGRQAATPADEAARQEIARVADKGSGENGQAATPPERTGRTGEPERAEEKPAAPNATQKPNGEALSEEEQREVTELATIDRKVRQHEMAHMAAGGELITSGARYEYQQGPDGQRYAVAGEVGIDTSEGRTPEETLVRARRIRAAALAPADPSPQDRSVAAAATQLEIRGQQEIAQNRQEERAAENTGNPYSSDATRAYQDMSANDGGQNRFSAYA